MKPSSSSRSIGQLLANLPHDMRDHRRHRPRDASSRRPPSGYDLVVAAGGDGTVHEVLNGLMRHPEADTAGSRPAPHRLRQRHRAARSACPTDLAQAALELATGERRRFDVGVCNGIYFNNSFAAGLDAQGDRQDGRVQGHQGTRSGLWLYLTALLNVLFTDLNELHLQIRFDGAEQPVSRSTRSSSP